MRELPNLDWTILKKALEMTEPPEDRPVPSRTTPQRSVPTRTVTNEFAGAFEQIMRDIEELDEQANVEATETHDYGKMRSLRKKVDDLKEILEEAKDNEEVVSMIEMQVPQEKIIALVDKLIGRKRKYEKVEGVPNLARQLEDAILEQRYEDAGIIQEKINRLKKVDPELVKAKVIEQIVVTADNLDLVEINKPYDEKNLPEIGKRHRFRFRNEPGGSDELFWEGMDGTKNKDKGIGSDQYEDVGSPASGNFAAIKPRMKPVMRPAEVNMPNEKMERDPQEEKATTDTWREFNDMQEK